MRATTRWRCRTRATSTRAAARSASIWVVPSRAIIASDPGDAETLLDPASPERKPYRHPTFYDIPDEVGHM